MCFYSDIDENVFLVAIETQNYDPSPSSYLEGQISAHCSQNRPYSCNTNISGTFIWQEIHGTHQNKQTISTKAESNYFASPQALYSRDKQKCHTDLLACTKFDLFWAGGKSKGVLHYYVPSYQTLWKQSLLKGYFIKNNLSNKEKNSIISLFITDQNANMTQSTWIHQIRPVGSD